MVNHKTALQDLAGRWVRARPRVGPILPVWREVAAEMAAAVTRREPYRAQALADGRIWLGRPTMAGIGLQIDIVEPHPIAPYADWEQSISPLKIKLRWSRTMGGGFTDEATAVIHRVALEKDQWRVVSFFSAGDRENLLAFQIETIWQALEDVKDPEIPVVSLVEMGIVRDVTVTGAGVLVKMTPTFSGCPALHVMQRDIKTRLQELGAEDVAIEVILSPPWTSDWITDEARQKLRQFGLAPPPQHDGNLIAVASLDVINCPRCDSKNTTLKNSFGPTLCRAIWYCGDCQEAFEQFKAL